MLNAVDQKLLTEVGSGTPMGRFMREYWTPFLQCHELEPGGDPTPVTVFGDRYVAYRTRDGQAGLMNEACPHRGASMRLARNEDCGLRCIYHGWKIAPSGALLEAPTHSPGAPLDRMRTGAHPVQERHGVVWAWLGEKAPADFPKHGWMSLPEGHVASAKSIINCNWLHPLETLWDVFHAQILHNETNRSGQRAGYFFSKEGDGSAGGLVYDFPQMETWATEYGFEYTNTDKAKVSTHSFVYPYYQYHPTWPGPKDDRSVQISVPVDDDHTLLWFVLFNRHNPLREDGLARTMLKQYPDPANMLKGFEDRSPENRWGQDREAMRRGESFNGIRAPTNLQQLFLEDVVAIESQGRADRTKELLAPVDSALADARRFIIQAVRTYEQTGVPPACDLDLSGIEATVTPSGRSDRERRIQLAPLSANSP